MSENSFDSLLDVVSDLREDMGSVKTSVEFIKNHVQNLAGIVESVRDFKIITETRDDDRKRDINKSMSRWALVASIVASIVSSASSYVFNRFTPIRPDQEEHLQKIIK